LNNLAHNLIQIKESPSLQILSDYDPTRTTTLRNQFAAEMGRKFKWLRGQIRKAIVDRDCFGLKNRMNVFQLPNHREFNFKRDAAKLVAFEQWLNEQVQQGILETFRAPQLGAGVEDVWTNRYIQTSYQKGIVRARNELRAAGIKDLGGMEIPSLGTDAAIQTAFNQPFHLDRVGLLYTRTFNDLKGITNNMDAQISRVLAQGMADGKGPYQIAELLTKTISGPVGDLSLTDTLGRFIPAERRAKILARTEIIRAHHAATIQEYRNWGLEGVKVKAEWTTAGDSRVCARCRALEGKIFTLKEIEGKIPLHPQCRCIALPVVDDGEEEELEVKETAKIPRGSGETDYGYFDQPLGKLDNAQLISSQDFIDDEIVKFKIKEKDFSVQMSPEFEIDGDKFRVIMDGHHSLHAAVEKKIVPDFYELSTTEADSLFYLEQNEVVSFLEAAYEGDDWRNVITRNFIW